MTHTDQLHGEESRGMNDRVHGISCRFSDQTGKEIAHIFLNIKSIFMHKSAYTFALLRANAHKCFQNTVEPELRSEAKNFFPESPCATSTFEPKETSNRA